MTERKNLGLGAMTNLLSSQSTESEEALQSALRLKIKELSLDPSDDKLRITFEDDNKLVIFDDGQSCCESRYMRTDDNLNDFIGATLMGVEVRNAPDVEDENYGVHEVQFLLVTTSKGVFVMSSHNEHNGYYGGFSIVIKGR